MKLCKEWTHLAPVAGFLSWRSHVWEDVDPDRTGILPFVWEDGFGFERYADYALDVPMYFAYRDHTYLDATQQRTTFRQFLDGQLSILPGERASPLAQTELQCC